MNAAGAARNLRLDVEHAGLDADFRHPKGRALPLAPEVVEAFEAEREHAEIFIQTATGIAFSCAEILDWFLLQSATTLADHLPARALDKAANEGMTARVSLTVPIRFAPGTFHMMTEVGAVDLSSLKLLIKVCVRAGSG